MDEEELSMELALHTLTGSIRLDASRSCTEDKVDTCADVKAVEDEVDDVTMVVEETEDTRTLLVGTG